MHHLRFYLPLQRVEDGLVFFAPGGVGSIPVDLQHYPTVVVSTDPSNEGRLVTTDRRGAKPSSQGKKEVTRGRRSEKIAAGTIEQNAPATGNSDIHSPIDESEDEVYTGDNTKNNRALLEAQAVARRLITLTKEADGGFVQGEDVAKEQSTLKEGLIITENGTAYIPSAQEPPTRNRLHVYGPMLSRVLTS